HLPDAEPDVCYYRSGQISVPATMVTRVSARRRGAVASPQGLLPGAVVIRTAWRRGTKQTSGSASGGLPANAVPAQGRQDGGTGEQQASADQNRSRVMHRQAMSERVREEHAQAHAGQQSNTAQERHDCYLLR